MNEDLNRRTFIGVTSAAALATTIAPAAEPGSAASIKIIGIACSPRKGMTTAECERWLRPVLAYEPSLVSA